MDGRRDTHDGEGRKEEARVEEGIQGNEGAREVEGHEEKQCLETFIRFSIGRRNVPYGACVPSAWP
jgi:hypothetical protein